jgi:hypothetical protein
MGLLDQTDPEVSFGRYSGESQSRVHMASTDN